MRVFTKREGRIVVGPREERVYPAGRFFNVDPWTAAALAKQGAIDPAEVEMVDGDEVAATVKPEGEALMTALVAAIKALSKDDEDAWTKGGKPSVPALVELLKFPISAAERDTAWKEASAEGDGGTSDQSDSEGADSDGGQESLPGTD